MIKCKNWNKTLIGSNLLQFFAKLNILKINFLFPRFISGNLIEIKVLQQTFQVQEWNNTDTKLIIHN